MIDLKYEIYSSFGLDIDNRFDGYYSSNKDKKHLTHFIVDNINDVRPSVLIIAFSPFKLVTRVITQYTKKSVYPYIYQNFNHIDKELLNEVLYSIDKLHCIKTYGNFAFTKVYSLSKTVSASDENFMLLYLTDYYIFLSRLPLHTVEMPEELKDLPKYTTGFKYPDEIFSMCKDRLTRDNAKFLDTYYFNKGLSLL